MRNSVTNSDGYCDTYTHSNAWAQAHPNAKAPADAASSPVSLRLRGQACRSLARRRVISEVVRLRQGYGEQVTDSL